MIEIIPAIDIIDGKCVRLSKGDYAQKKIYNESPLDVAIQFVDAGCNRLHLVDLDGAKANHIVNYKTLENIASHTNLIIDFGGGLKTSEDLHVAFESGAQMITGGSIAVKQPDIFESWLKSYTGEKIILGADVKAEKIATSGWLEESEEDIIPFVAHYIKKGVKKIISTDIECDGMLQGPSFSLYEKLLKEFPELFLIASGGISKMDDVLKLQDINVPAVIVGKAIYEGKITMKELERHNLSAYAC